MKITSLHFEHIKTEFNKIDRAALESHKQNLKETGGYKVFEVRVVYDIARAVRLGSFVSNELYKYLNDTHIQTAYLKAAKELALI